MPQGIQVFDANENLMIDVTNRLTRYVGTVDTGANSGQLTNDKLRTGDLWVSIIGVNTGTVDDSHAAEYPKIEKIDNTLKWTYSTAFRLQVKFSFGVY